MGNPYLYEKGIALIPSTAKNMKEVKKVTVKWNSGNKTYEKNNPIFKVFEESSGCFTLRDAFTKNGGTSYDHPSLKKLIRVEDYNDSAPQSCEVEKILSSRRMKGAKEPDFLVKFKGYRIEAWLPLSECKGCVDLIKEYQKKQEKEKKSKE